MLSSSDVDPMIGQQIDDHYRIEHVISEGAMGRVYLASHPRLSRRFAIKILFGELAAQEPMRERFAREAEAASRLEHRNLVSVVDFGESQRGLLYLVMEYIEGRTLDRIIRDEGTFPEERAVRIIHDLCRGLRHLHARGMVHRDLKLENVVVVHDRDVEVPKIVDFGIALIPTGRDVRLTRAGVIVGTPAFMSPEQAFGDAVDPRSDLFSLGIMLYHLLAGRGPFDGNAFEIIQKTVTQPMPRIAARNPNVAVSRELEQIMMKLISRHADDRPPSAQAVIDALLQLPLERSLSSYTPLPDFNESSTDKSAKKSWPMIAGIAGGVGLIGVISAVALVQRRRSPEPTSEPEPPPLAQPAQPAQLAQPTQIAPPPTLRAPKPARTKKSPKNRRRRTQRNERVAANTAESKLMPLEHDVDTRTRVALDLGASYQRIGKMIERLAEKRGNTAAAAYRLRHVSIPLPASLQTDAERTQVAKQLSALQRDLKVELDR